MTYRLTFLGCGASTGVPKINGDWGACNPQNPKNRRSRCSVLVERIGESGTTTVLIDTSPDLREQILASGTSKIDGVLYTHDHADHTHGIDDLRILAYAQRKRIDVYADKRTLGLLLRRFDYCFETPPGSSYPAIVKAHLIELGTPIVIDGAGGPIAFDPFRQLHGDIDSLGFRFANVAYSSDLHDLPPQSLPYVANLKLWVINTLRYTPHPSHLTLDQALEWIARCAPQAAILTHLHGDLDYDEVTAKLPSSVEVAYDGLAVEF